MAYKNAGKGDLLLNSQMVGLRLHPRVIAESIHLNMQVHMVVKEWV